jgi:hypothetical protein
MNIDIPPPTALVLRRVQQYEAARAEVAPFVGDIGYACDSADAVYRTALKRLGHDVSEIKAEGAATALWPVLRSKKPARSHAMATDSAAVSRRNEMFPNGNRLRQGYYRVIRF